MAEDVIRGKITVPKTLNRYGYCLSNPLRYVDLDGNSVKEVYDLFFDYEDFKIDSYGIQIGLHYLYGDGKSIVDIDGRWGNYLMENNTLTEKVGNIVIPIGESLEEGETINVSMTTSMEIENGEGIQGYQYLHGTNEEVGGFQISGEISKKLNGDMIFNLCYQWNDIMDPNFDYTTDIQKAEFAKKIPFANPTDFNMHIIWRNTTVIRKEESLLWKNSGWLAEWKGESIQFNTLEDLIQEMNLNPQMMIEISESTDICER